jgi:predicted transcriptional regulator
MSTEELRQSEKERRELAEREKGTVVEGSGRALTGRKLDQMVSLRLDPDLLRTLREIAEGSGNAVSDLIREAIVRWLSARETTQYSFSISRIETGLFADDLLGLLRPPTFAQVQEDESTRNRSTASSAVIR